MTQTQRDNAEWVRRLQAGEEEAWSELFDRCGPRIWRVICRTGGFWPGEEDQVEDIRQETLLAAIKSIRQYRGAASLETWLHRLACYKTIDHIRKRQRHPTVSLDAQDPETGKPTVQPPADENTPVDDLMRQERVARLELCLQVLRHHNEQWWAIVEMHYFGELRYWEVAEHLAIPLGTVRASLHRALKRLRECVKGTEVMGNKDAVSTDQ